MRGLVKNSGAAENSKENFSYVKEKKVKKMHPMFEQLKSKELREREEYLQMIRNKHLSLNSRDHKYDSLKHLSPTDDGNYPGAFMSVPRRRNPSEESEVRSRPRSLTKGFGATVGNKGPKNGIPESAVRVAMLGSLRSAASEDSLYESVEMIHYRKTLQTLTRQKKIRCVQKTGHALFDALREEQALREYQLPRRRRHCDPSYRLKGSDCHTSDGSTSSHSSSDEYDHIPQRPRCPQQETAPAKSQPVTKSQVEVPKRHSPQQKDPSRSESDDDWVIPRPKLAKPVKNRRQDVNYYYSSSNSTDSESSSKSAGLR